MRALVWVLSVRMPIWPPVRLTAFAPSEWIAIAISATLTCSPVERSMSISRAGASSVICLARSTRISVWWPMRADDHHDLVAILLSADRTAGGGPHLFGIRDARAAEFLND